MGKIRILHLIKSLGRGGAEMLLPESLKLHNQDKFEFHYIYFLPWKSQMVASIENAGGKVSCFNASNNFRMLLKYKEVIDYCKKEKINLIHCHLPWSGFLGRLIFRKVNLPVIYTEHNIQEHYHKVTKALNKYTYNNQSLAIGVSKDVTRSIKENIAPDIPVETVLNGVNTNFFKRNVEKGKKIRQYYGIPEEAIVLGNIAVFREQKALDVWIRAFAKIHEQDSSIYGIIVGAGPKEEEMKEQIKILELENKIFLPGLQTDTVSYFSAMDIFMMSSTFEGLPVALLEAMSLNCAVITTAAGGVVEVVQDKKNGLICEVGNEKALAGLAINLLEDKDLRTNLQQKARERIKEHFSLSSMVSELETIYLNKVKD
ncbi:glycosyltransferase [Salinimicrobium terrae]|uniref:glycosyltransferase n=1 Tax=Salinimicrobium terrae TaxID=470866 RepID=UPI0004228577|nr:glycosyltransferase [Salinimicrobium terrae]